MKILVIQVAVIAASLLVVAGVVFWIGDRSVLVPSPSATLEGFFRNLTTRRYVRALPYLTDSLAERVTPDDLRLLLDSLTARTGDVMNETGEGEGERMDGDMAEAVVSVETSVGTFAITLPMRRGQGVWKIAGLDGLLHPVAEH